MSYSPPDGELPVIRTDRVGPPSRRSPVAVLVISVLLVLVALAKPWAPSRPVPTGPPFDLAFPQVSAPAVATPQPTRAVNAVSEAWSAFFARISRSPRWEIWPASQIGSVKLAGPVAVTPEPTHSPAADQVELGAADRLVVMAVNHPRDISILDVRLWRMADTRLRPQRLPLIELPVGTARSGLRAFGLRVRDGDLELGGWRPGGYRLDLLLGAEIDAVQSVYLRVAEDSRGIIERGRLPPSSTMDDWGEPVGQLSPGLIAASGPGGTLIQPLGAGLRCLPVEVWRADIGYGDASCRSMTAPATLAITLRPAVNDIIESIALRQLDPGSGDVGRAVTYADGLAAVFTADGRPLAEGLYELEMDTRDEPPRFYYLEVPPGQGELARVGASH